MLMKLSVFLEKINLFYFLISFLLFAFLVKPGGEYSGNIDIPHITVNFTIFIPIFFMGALLFIFLLFIRRIKFDLLSLALIFRILLPLIPIIYEPQVIDFNGNIAILMSAVIVYLLAVNTVYHFEYLRKYLIIIFLLFCAQTAVESYLGTYSFFDSTYMYKNDLILPIGGSNAIASDIIPLGCLIYCTETKKRYKLFFVAVMLVTVILTKSRSGIIVSLIMIAIMEAWNRKSSVKTVFALIITLSAAILGGMYFILNTEIGSVAFTQNDSTVVGRLFLLNHGIDIISEHPLFGSGFAEQVAMYNPHNYLLYTLMAFGIIGLLLFFIITFYVFKKLSSHLSDSYVRGVALFVSCLLLQGLGEIVIYAPIIEFMTWFIVGVAFRRIEILESTKGEINGRCTNS